MTTPESIKERLDAGVVIERHVHVSDIFGCDVFFFADGICVEQEEEEALLHEIDDDPRFKWVACANSLTLDIYTLKLV